MGCNAEIIFLHTSSSNVLLRFSESLCLHIEAQYSLIIPKEKIKAYAFHLLLLITEH